MSKNLGIFFENSILIGWKKNVPHSTTGGWQLLLSPKGTQASVKKLAAVSCGSRKKLLFKIFGTFANFSKGAGNLTIFIF